MAKNLTEMAVEIATAQASHTAMSADEMGDFLTRTFQALKQMKVTEDIEAGKPTVSGPEAEPLEPSKSIQRNKVICLECQKEFKLLTNRHLKEHGMDLKGYRKKYGFSARQPLAAKTLSAKRRKTAKDLGLGGRLQKAVRAKAETKLETPASKRKVIRRRKKPETGSAEAKAA